MARELELIEGPGGWVLARLDGSNEWVQFVREKDGRWQPIWHLGMLEQGVANVTIPVRRIELGVNASEHVKAGLEKRLAESVPTPGTPAWDKAFSGFLRREERFVLERPAGRRLADSFYADVARAYRDALANGMNPRATIAEDAGVSPDVAGRWIYEARKPSRGFLPPTAPGKVST